MKSERSQSWLTIPKRFVHSVTGKDKGEKDQSERSQFKTLQRFATSGGGGSMLVPPVAQGGTGDRPVGDTGPRAQQSSGPATAATLWPLAPAQSNQLPNQQSQGIPPLAATPAPAHNQANASKIPGGVRKSGVTSGSGSLKNSIGGKGLKQDNKEADLCLSALKSPRPFPLERSAGGMRSGPSVRARSSCYSTYDMPMRRSCHPPIFLSKHAAYVS
ncbi:hypothetical protein KM043_011200 [Ampulex compressa]|nr:hypothetical protein KM043_011200 [Ampulex compressa]